MYKILIVEDDLTIAKTIEAHLVKWDYEVRCIKAVSYTHLVVCR